EQMIAFGIRRPFHPDLIQELERFPRQSKRGLKSLQTDFKLTSKQRMIKDSFSEGRAALCISQRIRHSPLSERNAHHAVRHTREVQNFQNQIDSQVSGTQQVSFAISQFHFSGGNRASGDLVFQSPDEVIETDV